MHSAISLVSPEIAFASFDLAGFGQICVPTHPMRFGFQVDIVPTTVPGRNVLFGLVGRLRDEAGHGRSVGFAVRIDLESGEVWDMINDTGLIGWLPTDDRHNLARFTDEEPMLLSWEVEHLGAALIPRLQIAGEEWLYPAVQRREPMILDTVAGCVGPRGCALETFLHPAVWRESL